MGDRRSLTITLRLGGRYRNLAESVVERLLWFTKRGYEITAVIGAEEVRRVG